MVPPSTAVPVAYASLRLGYFGAGRPLTRVSCRWGRTCRDSHHPNPPHGVGVGQWSTSRLPFLGWSRTAPALCRPGRNAWPPGIVPALA